MKVLVSGAKGFVGSRLCSELAGRGDTVVRLARKSSTGLSGDDIIWDYQAGQLDLGRLEGIDAVIHLAGENIMGRWSTGKKKRIYDSRIVSTRLLAESIAKLDNKPRVFVSASAVGFYGNTGDDIVDDRCQNGSSFLAEVCRDWEKSCEPAVDAGVRVANLRISMVLDRSGGPMAMMRPIFRMGLGGRLGNGKQWMAWVSLVDLVRAFMYVLDNNISGKFNVCSPNPVRNEDFTKALAKAYHRKPLLPVPGFILKLVCGEMASEVLLSSCRAIPKQLQECGFVFDHKNLDDSLPQIIVDNR